MVWTDKVSDKAVRRVFALPTYKRATNCHYRVSIRFNGDIHIYIHTYIRPIDDQEGRKEGFRNCLQLATGGGGMKNERTGKGRCSCWGQFCRIIYTYIHITDYRLPITSYLVTSLLFLLSFFLSFFLLPCSLFPIHVSSQICSAFIFLSFFLLHPYVYVFLI